MMKIRKDKTVSNPGEIIVKENENKIKQSSQDSSVGSTLDWYSEGPGFKSRRLQLNFQL